MFFLCQLALLTFISSGLWRDNSGWKDFVSWSGACSPGSYRVHSFSTVLWQHTWLPQRPAPAAEAASPGPRDSCKAQWSISPSSQQLPPHAFGMTYSRVRVSPVRRLPVCSPPSEQLTSTPWRADCQQVPGGKFLDNSTAQHHSDCSAIQSATAVPTGTGSQPWGKSSSHSISALGIVSAPHLCYSDILQSSLDFLPGNPLLLQFPVTVNNSLH